MSRTDVYPVLRAVAMDAKLSKPAGRLMAYLLSHAITQWEVWPSNATIARDLDMNRRVLRRTLHELREAGWIAGGTTCNRSGSPIVVAPNHAARGTATVPTPDRHGPLCETEGGPPRSPHRTATVPFQSPKEDHCGPPRQTKEDRHGPPKEDHCGPPKEDRHGPPEHKREQEREQGEENAAAAAAEREAGPVSIPMSDANRIPPDTLGGDEPLSPPPTRPVAGRDPEDAAMVTEAIAMLHGNLNLEPFGRLMAEMAAKRPELEGWRFLHAARRAAATTKPVRWPWVAKIVESAPRSEFESTITAQPKPSARAAANARALLL